LKFTFIFLEESFLILFLILWVFLLFDSVNSLISGLLFSAVCSSIAIPKEKQKIIKGKLKNVFSYPEFTFLVREIHQAKSIKRNA
jgi:hypothetical protein